MANSAESALHWVIGLKMMIFLIMMSNNYTCLLKEHPVFYQKPKEKVVVFFLCRQDNKSHWQSPDGIKAFTQNFFASHVTIANNCFLRSILDLIGPLIFKLYVFLQYCVFGKKKCINHFSRTNILITDFSPLAISFQASTKFGYLVTKKVNKDDRLINFVYCFTTCHIQHSSLVNYLAQFRNRKKLSHLSYLMVVWARYGCTE